MALNFVTVSLWGATMLSLRSVIQRPGPEVIASIMLNSTEHEISIAHKKGKMLKIKSFLALKLSDAVFIVLIVDILTFMSKINFLLS